MARKKPRGRGNAFTIFNVHYEDGMVTSNRRVPNDRLDQSYGEPLLELARVAIEEQDREIAERSGQPRRGRIKAIVPA